MSYYILDENGNPVLEKDLEKWVLWFEMSIKTRRIAKDEKGGVCVSTVFLGMDHNFVEGGEPILWETMIFGGPKNDFQQRCSGNLENAKAMHRDICQLAGVPSSV